jgi:hypothetical protein
MSGRTAMNVNGRNSVVKTAISLMNFASLAASSVVVRVSVVALRLLRNIS